jgi:ribosomal protein S12 methylthiotransferase
MNADAAGPGTYRFVNLGCPKNLVDAERVASLLESGGWREAPSPEEASLLVVTTCAFIASAREESVDEIVRAVAGRRPGQRIAVLGCLVTRESADELRRVLPEVDIFCGVAEMTELPSRLVESAAARPARRRDGAAAHFREGPGRKLFTPPHLAYLKIADGCSNRCAYCAIPAIRGDLASRSRNEILAEARGLAAMGVRELVVVAQDTTAWGFDRGDGERVYDLIEALADAGLFEWIRLLYTHPAHLDPARIVPLLRGGALVPYLDVPIQHASDRVLELMGRPYTRRALEDLFDALRAGAGDLVLRTTVLVGFPGERERDFRELASFLESAAFDHVGVFAYSRERETAAASLGGRVPARVAMQRRDEILELQMDVSEERLASRVGTELDVLVDEELPADERPVPGARFAGRFFGQAHDIDGVTYLEGPAPGPGGFVRARVAGAGPYDLFAEAIPGDFR